MSEFILEEPTSKGFVKGKIYDVTFLYTNIQKSRDKFSKEGKEFSVKLLVDKKTAKAFKKQYPKNGFREVETQVFQEQYGIEPTHPEEEYQYIITLKCPDDKFTKVVENGQEVNRLVKLTYGEFKRPKVYVPVSDGVVKDITMDLNVGNGSSGAASFWVLDAHDFGTFPRLSGILVEDLIVYENTSSNLSDFGSVTSDAPPTPFDKTDDQISY